MDYKTLVESILHNVPKSNHYVALLPTLLPFRLHEIENVLENINEFKRKHALRMIDHTIIEIKLNITDFPDNTIVKLQELAISVIDKNLDEIKIQIQNMRI